MKPDLAVCLTYNKAALVWQHSSNFSLTKTLTTASASKERIRPELSDVQVTYLSRNAQASSRLKLELDSSIELLEAGTTELETGTTELETGASELDAGTSELEAGTTELETGASELLDFALEEDTDELVPPCPEEDDLAELLDLASLELTELLDLPSL
jgi:X-X-X-Leu-X-X-Gly heptad repeat protein